LLSQSEAQEKLVILQKEERYLIEELQSVPSSGNV
jgi:hypothetical protein